jgi:hypothetical protein
LKGCTAPSAERVPSGKTSTAQPAAARARHAAKPERTQPRRASGNAFTSSVASHPTSGRANQ